MPCGRVKPANGNAVWKKKKPGLDYFYRYLTFSIPVLQARRIGFEASECIVFEDSISGVESGLRSGAKVIGVTTTHSRADLSSCHLVIDHFGGLTPDDLAELFEAGVPG